MSDTKRKAATRQEIALRAYEIYLKRGGESSGELDDWLAAEKELTESRQTDAHKPTMPDVTLLRKLAAVAKR